MIPWTWWWAWSQERWRYSRHVMASHFLNIGLACMPEGMMKRELRQALWVWRSSVDMQIAVMMQNESHNTDLYPQTTYAETLPERFRNKKRRNNRR